MRQRSLSTRFWCDEDLVDLPRDDRLLFAGLWCMADREGRLEDRPRRIRLELHLGDDYDIEAGLSRLVGRGKVVRYAVGGSAYMGIPSFAKYGHPHPTERRSVIPGEPNEVHGNLSEPNEVHGGLSESQPCPSITSSTSSTSSNSEDVANATSPPVVPQELFELWRLETGHLAAKFTDERRRKIAARLREGFSEEELCDAVRGIALDPWPERVLHNDLTQVFRSGAQVEKFRDLWRSPHPVHPIRPLSENPIDRRIREFGTTVTA